MKNCFTNATVMWTEREFGRKPAAEDWKDIQAVLGGEYD